MELLQSSRQKGTRVMAGQAQASTDGLRERKRAQARATTIDVALALFTERGYENVTVADICAEAQIAPRSFFRYFPTKEDLLLEPSREMTARVETAIATAPGGLDDVEIIRGAMRQSAEYVVDDRQRLAVFFRITEEAALRQSTPFVRLSERERQISEFLVRRRSATASPDWPTRLMVARAVAGFRVWLDDVMGEELADPLGHLDEILAAP
jgi:AcrR family transcriptional regulator